MNMITFVIYKQENKWGVESTNYNKLVRSQHNSRAKALGALFNRYPNLTSFHITLPIIGDTKLQDFVFRKSLTRSLIQNKKVWLVELREYTSRIKAIHGFFNRHPGITLFYVAIPVKQTRED